MLTLDELRLLREVVVEEAEESQGLYLDFTNRSRTLLDYYKTRDEKARQALDLIDRELNKE